MYHGNFNYGDETRFLQKRKARGQGIRHKWYRADSDEQDRKDDRLTAMHFEKYASDGHRFINHVADELDVSLNMAARITRAVLHAVRDRISPDDAIEFAQGLPMALKGIYIDRYDLSETPVRIRNRAEFLDYVREKDRQNAAVDFPSQASVIDAIRAVFRVLEDTVDPGQVRHIKKMFNKELQPLFERP
jgi:uncharacterized protein (DUF2267 family)